MWMIMWSGIKHNGCCALNPAQPAGCRCVALRHSSLLIAPELRAQHATSGLRLRDWGLPLEFVQQRLPGAWLEDALLLQGCQKCGHPFKIPRSRITDALHRRQLVYVRNKTCFGVASRVPLPAAKSQLPVCPVTWSGFRVWSRALQKLGTNTFS